MFPCLPARTTFVADTKFVSATNVPSLRSPRNIMGNNVSATMCPRLQGPLDILICIVKNIYFYMKFVQCKLYYNNSIKLQYIFEITAAVSSHYQRKV